MREITIQELEVVSGGVAPIIVAGAVILGKAEVGATAGALGYLTTNSILGEQPTSKGAASAATTGAFVTTFGPLSPNILRLSIGGGFAGGIGGRAADGSEYSDGTNY